MTISLQETLSRVRSIPVDQFGPFTRNIARELTKTKDYEEMMVAVIQQDDPISALTVAFSIGIALGLKWAEYNLEATTMPIPPQKREVN